MKNLIKCIILILAVCLFKSASAAENHAVSGTVTNQDGQPLPGATVILSNDKITAADDDGKFVFHEIEAGTYTLSVTMVGYDAYTKKIKVKNTPVTLNLILKAQTKTLNEVNVTPKISTKISAKIMTTEETEEEQKKMLGPTPDNHIYDTEGNVVDSAKAADMLRSYDYEMALRKLKGQDAFKHVIIKTDTRVQLMSYQYMRTLPYLRVQSPKLQDGLTLDLKPLVKRIDTATLSGKAIIMIFWCPECYRGSKSDQYREVNDAIAPFANSDKLQVLALTKAQTYQANDALKKSPILNARMLTEASSVTYKYDLDDTPVIIMTDTKHKIIFSMAGWNPITPPVLHNLLKSIPI
ncbi:carboxypeptidase-like regulatory domain-containing protein [Mucilaginibacter corticis]|uniref:Carboxypeptidase-like regulatory domain-containing protein n=1 Tax=Mucilaginibacter corticis TaxID=2597670 RepID=A0A556MHP3_9SPHI|nr:carboxypeptidase-like regulatory domain-containing protein [Mucilaginibacter corticis]TSJ39389.1 carboxypeptidase-like regulatory domain-containing protein [Mucilaginibacter corticis]